MAKSWKEITSEEDLDEIAVELKPRFGVTPEVYVPAIGAAVLLLVLFFVLLFPGLRAYGTHLTVESSPAGAEVYIDGVRRGATPLTVFVPAGERTLEVGLAGFPETGRTLTVRGRRFGSWLFPMSETATIVLDQPDLSAVQTDSIVDFSAWSLGLEPGAQFQHPPVARDGSRRLWTRRVDDSADPLNTTDYVRDLLAHAQRFQRADVLGAILRVENPGAVLNAASLAAAVQNFIHLDNKYPGFHHVVEGLVPEVPSGVAAWRDARSDQFSTELLALSVSLDEGVSPPLQRRHVGGLEFVAVPPGRYAIGYPLRDQDDTGVLVDFEEGFWIQNTEVDRGTFARFLQEKPEWAPENRKEEDYLRDWPAEIAGEDARLPVRYVTRDAAEAFAAWFQETFTPADGTVRLPTSAEWEYAAFLNDSGDSLETPGEPVPVDQLPVGALGAHRMTGNLWEWTGDWFGRYAHILTPDAGATVTVMGGSFANASPVHNLRGGQAPDRATPFLGFRVVIAPDREE